MEIKSSLFSASSLLINTNIARKPFSKVLLIGYGDPEREDRGIAWHIFLNLARCLNRTIPVEPREGFYSSGFPADMIFVPHLVPSLAERLVDYERACFITAHTEPEKEAIVWKELSPETAVVADPPVIDPGICIATTFDLFGHAPEAVYLSVRAFSSGRSRSLSLPASRLLPEITEQLLGWLAKK
ncbi:MAG TPA: hypothetical protein VFF68_12105 [Anaerolineaceae bacterium]|nr:hypothetical protein [Anaerolineaceae bacterium]